VRILAFDTALDACSVAVCETDRVIAHRHEVLSKGHAERLLPMIELALADAGTQFQDIELVAVTVGPGTFTGIRIGLSAARGIALTTGVKVAGVTTLAAIAEGARESSAAAEETAIAVLHDARRGELFCQIFSSDVDSPPPELIALTDAVSMIPAGPAMVVGSGVRQVEEQILKYRPDVRFSSAPINPDAIFVAGIGARQAKMGIVGIDPPEPLYLRAPDARLPGKRSE
jgi:tRNA threonylcarbamoyladenosine biosynthesis protein TsaB